MDARHSIGLFSIISFLTVTTVGCGSGGGTSGGTGLASGNACVSVNGGAEVCVSSGVTADRNVDSGTIHASVSHWSNIDCFSRPANEFVLNLSIPDGLPFPYQANQRPGNAQFGTSTCAWENSGFEADLVSGTIYQAGTANNSTHLEGDITSSFRDGNSAVLCSNTCVGATCNCPDTATVTAHFRFNVPL